MILQESSKVLDRGGQPTVRELLSRLVFNPHTGTISLNGDRIVMQRAATSTALRHELVQMLGTKEARVFLLRLGFQAGSADARFVRTCWPNLDAGDAFTAGTRLHMFSGVVRVETVYNTYDFRKKRLSAEFLWHDSVEAAEFKQTGKTSDAMCWSQLGYASGYASEFFDTLIVYKEAQCAAQGHKHCRVVGKPADVWGAQDPEVVLFRERIIGPQQSTPPKSAYAAAASVADSTLTAFDRLILAPVRDELDRLAQMPLPVLISGPPGTGRSRAARYLHRASGAVRSDVRHAFGCQIDLAFCADIARAPKSVNKRPAEETIIIDTMSAIPKDIQPHLTRAVETGMLIGGPRIVVLSGHDGPDCPEDFYPELWLLLLPLHVRMPTLAERNGQRADLAREILMLLASIMKRQAPPLDAGAAELIEHCDWPGNLRQMRGVLAAALAGHCDDSAMSAQEIAAHLTRFAKTAVLPDPGGAASLEPLVETRMQQGNFSLSELERTAYRIALDKAGGNLSAAARLLGLTRAQLAYRIGERSGAK